jgi:hypothetical protein
MLPCTPVQYYHDYVISDRYSTNRSIVEIEPYSGAGSSVRSLLVWYQVLAILQAHTRSPRHSGGQDL